MKVDFDNLRVTAVEAFNKVVTGIDAHTDKEGYVVMDAGERGVLAGRIDHLRSVLVCLAFLSGENETFG